MFVGHTVGTDTLVPCSSPLKLFFECIHKFLHVAGYTSQVGSMHVIKDPQTLFGWLFAFSQALNPSVPSILCYANGNI